MELKTSLFGPDRRTGPVYCVRWVNKVRTYEVSYTVFQMVLSCTDMETHCGSVEARIRT